MGRILDHNGNVIDQAVLTTEIATAQMTGVRQLWQGSVAAGITPHRVVSVLENSITWDPIDYLTLAEEMEEREPHYFSVLGTRKLSVDSIEPIVEAASDSSQDVKIADAVREMFKQPCVEESRAQALDALGKSFSVNEIKWDRSGRQWMPEAVLHRDPRWFQFDRETCQQLRLRDQADVLNGLPLQPFKFIVHRPRLKSGLPIRNGLARIVAFMWVCKAYALKDWMAFAEVFGMPVRVGSYGPGASRGDIATLRRAVANIGTDAACVIPQSMKIDFQQAGNVSGAADLFQRLCDYLDRQISKIVLGQTMSADSQASGIGSGNAKLHGEVRDDICDADGKQLASTYNRDLVRPFVDLNFGPQAKYPYVVIKKKKPEDIKAMTDALAVLVPMGFKVEQSVVRDKMGLPDPAEGKDVDLLRAPAKAPAPVPVVERAQNTRQRPVVDVVDNQADRLARDVDTELQGFVLEVRKLLDSSESLEQFRDRLLDAYPNMDAGRFATAIQYALAAAQLTGRYEIMEQAGGNPG